MNFDAKAIAGATGGRVLSPGPAGSIQTDTRKLAPGSWFLAIRGDRFDGHDFLDTAAAAGAVGVVVDRPPAGWSGGAVLVEDTTRALQDLGRYARRLADVPVVGLTGSAGKTTTRALIALALSPLGHVHQTVGNLNNHWGVPMTLVATPELRDALVIEMGTSSPGEIALLADISRPTIRLIVNIGPSHLLELGGIDGVAREKGALFATAARGDVLCVNLDDSRIREIERPAGTTMVTYGVHSDAVIRLGDATIDPLTLHTRAVFETPQGTLITVLPAPGVHIAHNAAAALAVAWSAGVDLKAAAAAMTRYEPVGMRLRRESLPGGVVALNDAYNANPSSMEASLRVLAGLPGRRVGVLGAMLELGGDEAKWHGYVAGLAGKLGLDLVVLVGAEMGMAAPCCEGAGELWVHREAEDVVHPLRQWLREGDHVLFKGSRGARIERVLHGLQDKGA